MEGLGGKYRCCGTDILSKCHSGWYRSVALEPHLALRPRRYKTPEWAVPRHSSSLRQTFYRVVFGRTEPSYPQRYQLPHLLYPHHQKREGYLSHNRDGWQDQMPQKDLFAPQPDFCGKKHLIL